MSLRDISKFYFLTFLIFPNPVHLGFFFLPQRLHTLQGHQQPLLNSRDHRHPSFMFSLPLWCWWPFPSSWDAATWCLSKCPINTTSSYPNWSHPHGHECANIPALSALSKKDHHSLFPKTNNPGATLSHFCPPNTINCQHSPTIPQTLETQRFSITHLAATLLWSDWGLFMIWCTSFLWIFVCFTMQI